MNDKYYTPTVEEFHVGFEYEETTHSSLYEDEGLNNWVKNTLKHLWQLGNIGLHETVRVKYLDREDIESLGWKITKNYTGELEAQFLISETLFYDLTLDYEGNLLIEKFISTETIGSYNSFIIFEGSIKNKSELKWLMKRLKILE